MPGVRSPDPEQAAAVLDDALAAGHEGVVVKALDAAYAAGRRGKAWQKVKPVHTLDLVVLGAEWGYGRRTGKLSNIHLGARDPDGGEPVMVGKTFKGMTDELLDWQTRTFPELAREQPDWGVLLRPGARRRDRRRRRPAQHPLPRRRRPAVRPRAALPARTRRRPRPTPSTPSARSGTACSQRPPATGPSPSSGAVDLWTGV